MKSGGSKTDKSLNCSECSQSELALWYHHVANLIYCLGIVTVSCLLHVLLLADMTPHEEAPITSGVEGAANKGQKMLR